jgi:hypothetical protein
MLKRPIVRQLYRFLQMTGEDKRPVMAQGGFKVTAAG